jgi:hypothetical protein
MSYLDVDEDEIETIGEAMRRSRERESRENAIERTGAPTVEDYEPPTLASAEPVTPANVVARAEDDAAGARDEMDRTEDERAELFRSTPTGPGTSFVGAPPVDDDSSGIVTRGGPPADPDDDAGRYLADYDLSALDALDDPGIATAPAEAPFVPLTDDAMATMEAPINEIDMSAMEPMTITGSSSTEPMQGDDDADAGSIFATEFATDEDPVLPGRARPEGAVGGQGPGGWADDDDATLAGADARLALNGPDAEIYGMATDADPTLPARPGAVMPSYDDESGFWGAAGEDEPELPGSGPDPEAMMLDALEDDDPGGMALAAPTMGGGEFGEDMVGKVPTEPGSDQRALDAGLPTEGDIAGEEGWDVVRQITGRLGNAFRAVAGRPTRAINTVAPGMEEERREGIEGRLNAKGATELADRRAGAAAESAERLATIRREPTELEVTREARLAADAARDDELTGRRLDLTERGLDDRAASTEAERASEAAMRDPASPESARARERLAAEMEGLPARLREAITGGHDMSTMSASDVQAMERSIPSFARSMLGRGGGTGGGGGGAAPTADALVEQAVATGRMTEPEARAMIAAVGPRRFASAVLTDTLARGRADVAAERRGVTDEGTILADGIHATIPVTAAAAQRWHDGWDEVRGRMDALSSINRIATEAGPVGRITPEIANALEPHMMTLRGMAAAAQGSGIINPSEMPAINAALPDATSLAGMTMGGYQAAMREWRNLMTTAIRRRMESYGVSEGEITGALGALASGGRVPSSAGRRPAAAPAASGETVRVRLPDGRVGRLPMADVEAAGAEVIE